MNKSTFKYGLLGFAAGILNGIFGAGGGLLVVPMLQAQELEPRRSHATSIAIILPLSVISALLCLVQGVKLDWDLLWQTTPLGLAGAAAGSLLLAKLKNSWLKRLFGVVMILSAVRIFFR